MCSVPVAYGSGTPEAATLEALGDDISRLAGHLNAGTARLIGLIGAFDADYGWAHWGCRSCVEWLGWRCGMGKASAREHVRVAKALRDLPKIRTAFEAGE